MDAVDKYLIRKDDALVQLLDPPFDKSDLNPGYIKGYVPGVRENGGQYTHAAIWAAMAFAAMGDSKRAWEILTMINPVNHGGSAQGIGTYKVEPYVVAADVYAVAAPHGPWRMDVVHWISRMDVPADIRITPGAETRSRQAVYRALYSRRLGGLHNSLPLPGDHLPYKGRADSRGRRHDGHCGRS